VKEKHIEQYLIKRVRETLGGIAYKFVSPGRRSVPDRICVIPKYVFFVECKAPGKSSTDAQLREQQKLELLDQWVYTVASKYSIDKIIEFWYKRLEEEGLL